LADGSAKFLSESMNYETLCRLAFIHDGNTIGDF